MKKIIFTILSFSIFLFSVFSLDNNSLPVVSDYKNTNDNKFHFSFIKTVNKNQNDTHFKITKYGSSDSDKTSDDYLTDGIGNSVVGGIFTISGSIVLGLGLYYYFYYYNISVQISKFSSYNDQTYLYDKYYPAGYMFGSSYYMLYISMIASGALGLLLGLICDADGIYNLVNYGIIISDDKKSKTASIMPIIDIGNNVSLGFKINFF